MRTLLHLGLIITTATAACSTTADTGAVSTLPDGSPVVVETETPTGAGSLETPTALDRFTSPLRPPDQRASIAGPAVTSIDAHDHDHDDPPAVVLWPVPPQRDADVEAIAGFVGLVVLNDHPSRPRSMIAGYLTPEIAEDYLTPTHPDNVDPIEAVLIEAWPDTALSNETTSVAHALFERTRHGSSRFEQLVVTVTFAHSPTGWLITSLEVT